jgi:hypothetical protein
VDRIANWIVGNYAEGAIHEPRIELNCLMSASQGFLEIIMVFASVNPIPAIVEIRNDGAQYTRKPPAQSAF